MVRGNRLMWPKLPGACTSIAESMEGSNSQSYLENAKANPNKPLPGYAYYDKYFGQWLTKTFIKTLFFYFWSLLKLSRNTISSTFRKLKMVNKWLNYK